MNDAAWRGVLTMVPAKMVTKREFTAPRSAPARRKPFPVVILEERPWHELVAQLVEQRPFKAWVLGSSPSELTIQNK